VEGVTAFVVSIIHTKETLYNMKDAALITRDYEWLRTLIELEKGFTKFGYLKSEKEHRAERGSYL
jgi:hypothetical protein